MKYRKSKVAMKSSISALIVSGLYINRMTIKLDNHARLCHASM